MTYLRSTLIFPVLIFSVIILNPAITYAILPPVPVNSAQIVKYCEESQLKKIVLDPKNEALTVEYIPGTQVVSPTTIDMNFDGSVLKGEILQKTQTGTSTVLFRNITPDVQKKLFGTDTFQTDQSILFKTDVQLEERFNEVVAPQNSNLNVDSGAVRVLGSSTIAGNTAEGCQIFLAQLQQQQQTPVQIQVQAQPALNPNLAPTPSTIPVDLPCSKDSKNPNCTSASSIPCNTRTGYTPAKGTSWEDFINNTPQQERGVFTAIGCVPTEPTALIGGLLRFSTLAGGGIALLLMIFGAIQYITSAGNPEALKKAQDQFTNAFIGLLFIIFATLLLQIIGADILNLPGFSK